VKLAIVAPFAGRLLKFNEPSVQLSGSWEYSLDGIERVFQSALCRVREWRANVGRRDDPLRMQDGLEHRGARLSEACRYDRKQRLMMEPPFLDLAPHPALNHVDETLGAHVRRRRDGAGGAEK